uniref:SHSP domain-containing protein n=1 Tax=Rhabditophanes sp. KR3021 TaxID=114890 RepID=A0AC35TPH1_9BILA
MSAGRTDEFLCDWPLQHEEDGIVKSSIVGNRFQLTFDCQQFDPQDIQVIVTEDRLNIRAHHDKRRGSDLPERDIARTYRLPSGVNPKSVQHTLRPDGELVITAEKFNSSIN